MLLIPLHIKISKSLINLIYFKLRQHINVLDFGFCWNHSEFSISENAKWVPPRIGAQQMCTRIKICLTQLFNNHKRLPPKIDFFTLAPIKMRTAINIVLQHKPSAVVHLLPRWRRRDSHHTHTHHTWYSSHMLWGLYCGHLCTFTDRPKTKTNSAINAARETPQNDRRPIFSPPPSPDCGVTLIKVLYRQCVYVCVNVKLATTKPRLNGAHKKKPQTCVCVCGKALFLFCTRSWRIIQ